MCSKQQVWLRLFKYHSWALQSSTESRCCLFFKILDAKCFANYICYSENSLCSYTVGKEAFFWFPTIWKYYVILLVFYYYVQEANQPIPFHKAKLAGRLKSYYEMFISLRHHSDRCKIEYQTHFLFPN